MLLIFVLSGCSNQQDSSGTNQNSEMNATEKVTEEMKSACLWSFITVMKGSI